jgi:hypothetical protein
MEQTGNRTGRSPSVQHVSEGCVIGTLDDIVLVIWTEQPRLDQVLELRKVLDLISYRYSAGSSVHVLSDRPGLPEKRVRDEMARVTEDYADQSIASALVLNGDGFWASAMRGLATSLHFLGTKRDRFKLRVCATVEQAAAWLVPVHNERSRRPANVEEVASALHELCTRAGKRPKVLRTRSIF